MGGISKSLKILGEWSATIQEGLLFFLMSLLSVAMLAEVLTRYLFKTSLFGVEQFIGYAAVWLYLIGASYGTYERSHIKAEFINVIVKSKRKRDIIRTISAALSTFMSAIFTKWSWSYCVESVLTKETTPTHNVPMIYFQSALLVGAALMTIYFLWEMIEAAQKAAFPEQRG